MISVRTPAYIIYRVNPRRGSLIQQRNACVEQLYGSVREIRRTVLSRRTSFFVGLKAPGGTVEDRVCGGVHNVR